MAMNSEEGQGRLILATFLLAIGGVIFVGLGAWTWLLRDGLGPDSIESNGREAFLRFAEQFWPIAVFSLLLFTICYFLATRH